MRRVRIKALLLPSFLSFFSPILIVGSRAAPSSLACLLLYAEGPFAWRPPPLPRHYGICVVTPPAGGRPWPDGKWKRGISEQRERDVSRNDPFLSLARGMGGGDRDRFYRSLSPPPPMKNCCSGVSPGFSSIFPPSRISRSLLLFPFSRPRRESVGIHSRGEEKGEEREGEEKGGGQTP